MSAIAQYLSQDGLAITGSDRITDESSVRNNLEALGCKIYPQDGSGLSSKTDALVVSTAIEETNPDVAAARRLNVPILHRSDILAAIANSKQTIAVAGTNGKSTVAALIFHLLSSCGKKPSFISGAALNGLKGGNAFKGKSELLVIEADESDGSLVKYKPFITVLLNISKDHHLEADTLKMFEQIARQSKQVFKNADDSLLGDIRAFKTYALKSPADFRPEKVEVKEASVSIFKDGGEFRLPYPGEYNAYNLCAALVVSSSLGCGLDALADGCASYPGIERRFHRIPSKNGVTVIDDYAHNPEKVRAVLTTVTKLSSTVLAIFQPHGFGPTKFLMKEFIAAFRSSLRPNDTLYLSPIYYAGGTAKKDISSSDIAEGLKDCTFKVVVLNKREDAIAAIAQSAKPGNIVISMGARDPSLSEFAQSIAQAIQ